MCSSNLIFPDSGPKFQNGQMKMIKIYFDQTNILTHSILTLDTRSQQQLSFFKKCESKNLVKQFFLLRKEQKMCAKIAELSLITRIIKTQSTLGYIFVLF